MNRDAANVLTIATEIGKLYLEHRNRKALEQMNDAEAIDGLREATAAFRPKPTAEAIAEGAALAGGDEDEGGG